MNLNILLFLINPADQAAIESAKYNANASRTDAAGLMTSATQNAMMFTDQANQKLAQGVSILGKTGNLGDTANAMPQSGVDLGAKQSPEAIAERKKQNDIIKTLNLEPNKIIMAAGGQPGKVLQDSLKQAQDTLATLGPEAGIADIKNPDSLAYASGSDLLTMVNTRDAMERDKRTLMRNAQSEAVKAINAGANYDKMATYGQQAQDWNSWSTILSGGIKMADMAKMFG